MSTMQEAGRDGNPGGAPASAGWWEIPDAPTTEVPPRALAISVFALAVAALGAFLRPESGAEYAGFLWMLGLVPPFLLSFYHGWTGAVRALVAGMVALTVAEVAGGFLGESIDWWIYGGATAGLIVVSLGSGVLAERLHRSGGSPGTADREGARRQDLLRAVEEGQLVLHFQPIVTLEERRTVGIEALVRWNHPRRGLLDAAEFVDFAESAGLLVPIGNWAIDEALRQFGLWRDKFPSSEEFFVSINVSESQCRQRGFVERIRSLLDREGMEAGCLHLEVSEETLNAAGTQLSQMVGLGVRLSIDDFGTGYVSLSQLARLRIDTLKIDGFFVGRMLTSPEDRATVDAIVRVGDAMGFRVTAEAVETEEQLQLLRRLGCGRGQGNFFAAPFPAASLEGRLVPE